MSITWSTCPLCGQSFTCDPMTAHECLPPITVTAEPAPPIAPAPQWSTEPPREPGWYWSELECGTRPPIWSRAPRKIIEDDGVLYQINGQNDPRDVREMSTRGWRWWPIPIIEPPADAGKETK